MLSQEQIELLTAYVDGELSPRQRQAALRLMNESTDARGLFIQLQENAHQIRQLPRHALDEAFTAEILAAVATRPMEPAQPHQPVAVSLRWLPYAAAATAAVLFFMVVTAGALYVAFG